MSSIKSNSKSKEKVEEKSTNCSFCDKNVKNRLKWSEREFLCKRCKKIDCGSEKCRKEHKKKCPDAFIEFPSDSDSDEEEKSKVKEYKCEYCDVRYKSTHSKARCSDCGSTCCESFGCYKNHLSCCDNKQFRDKNSAGEVKVIQSNKDKPKKVNLCLSCDGETDHTKECPSRLKKKSIPYSECDYCDKKLNDSVDEHQCPECDKNVCTSLSCFRQHGHSCTSDFRDIRDPKTKTKRSNLCIYCGDKWTDHCSDCSFKVCEDDECRATHLEECGDSLPSKEDKLEEANRLKIKQRIFCYTCQKETNLDDTVKGCCEACIKKSINDNTKKDVVSKKLPQTIVNIEKDGKTITMLSKCGRCQKEVKKGDIDEDGICVKCFNTQVQSALDSPGKAKSSLPTCSKCKKETKKDKLCDGICVDCTKEEVKKSLDSTKSKEKAQSSELLHICAMCDCPISLVKFKLDDWRCEFGCKTLLCGSDTCNETHWENCTSKKKEKEKEKKIFKSNEKRRTCDECATVFVIPAGRRKSEFQCDECEDWLCEKEDCHEEHESNCIKKNDEDGLCCSTKGCLEEVDEVGEELCDSCKDKAREKRKQKKKEITKTDKMCSNEDCCNEVDEAGNKLCESCYGVKYGDGAIIEFAKHLEINPKTTKKDKKKEEEKESNPLCIHCESNYAEQTKKNFCEKCKAYVCHEGLCVNGIHCEECSSVYNPVGTEFKCKTCLFSPIKKCKGNDCEQLLHFPDTMCVVCKEKEIKKAPKPLVNSEADSNKTVKRDSEPIAASSSNAVEPSFIKDQVKCRLCNNVFDHNKSSEEEDHSCKYCKEVFCGHNCTYNHYYTIHGECCDKKHDEEEKINKMIESSDSDSESSDEDSDESDESDDSDDDEDEDQDLPDEAKCFVCEVMIKGKSNINQCSSCEQYMCKSGKCIEAHDDEGCDGDKDNECAHCHQITFCGESCDGCGDDPICTRDSCKEEAVHCNNCGDKYSDVLGDKPKFICPCGKTHCSTECVGECFLSFYTEAHSSFKCSMCQKDVSSPVNSVENDNIDFYVMKCTTCDKLVCGSSECKLNHSHEMCKPTLDKKVEIKPYSIKGECKRCNKETELDNGWCEKCNRWCHPVDPKKETNKTVTKHIDISGNKPKILLFIDQLNSESFSWKVQEYHQAEECAPLIADLILKNMIESRYIGKKEVKKAKSKILKKLGIYKDKEYSDIYIKHNGDFLKCVTQWIIDTIGEHWGVGEGSIIGGGEYNYDDDGDLIEDKLGFDLLFVAPPFEAPVKTSIEIVAMENDADYRPTSPVPVEEEKKEEEKSTVNMNGKRSIDSDSDSIEPESKKAKIC